MRPRAPVITELDALRIRELGARLPDRGRSLTALGTLLALVGEEAEIVPGERIAADVVTVNSTVSFRDLAAGENHTVTLVYPPEASITQRRISILSPVGQALLGRRVGDTTTVAMPDGDPRRLRLLRLLYQPEAAGDFAL